MTGRPTGKEIVRRIVHAAAGRPKLRRYLDLAAQELDEAVRELGKETAPRTQYRMVKELATDAPATNVRAFHVGHDEAALLRINNAAFSWHPEQGGWDARRLDEIFSQHWFDPSDILLAEGDVEPTGFCWTRTFISRGQREGAIWVIAVSGQKRRQGLGQSLLAAGEHHLYRQGCRTSTLYVDASNQEALILFIRSGYVVDRVERLYGQAPLCPPT